MTNYGQQIRVSKIMRRSSNLALVVFSCSAALFFFAIAVSGCWAQSYDPAADFEQGFINETNPNGVWSYGYSSSFTTPITLYDQTQQPGINGPNAQFWISSSINYGESPSAEYNDGPAYDDGNIDFLANEFLLVSGIAGQYSNLVFTAPVAGTYSITGSFRGCQYGIGVVVGIVVNGNVIFSSPVGSEGQIVPFGTVVTLTAGQTVVFSVGPNGGLQNTGLAATISRQTGTYAVLHNFTGEQDGANPTSGVTLDAGGSLYGTTFNGGIGFGAAYKLKSSVSGWLLNPLYSFAGGSDGANPTARLIFGPDGALYSTTLYDGLGYGTVFKLQPPPRACATVFCPWMKTELYSFQGDPDGAFPEIAELIFDHAGNLYGTTYNGGLSIGLGGTVYELTPSGNGNWTESVLYRFMGPPDGERADAGVILDSGGNLYGTTHDGGQYGYGIVYKLSPSNGNWTESVLYSFQNGSDGGNPYSGLILDSGNLYGATSSDTSGGGTVFELSPSGGGWTLTTLYSFVGSPMGGFGCGPVGSIVMSAGSIYGTTLCDGVFQYGNVFKLTPSNGSWIYTDLHDFTGGSDGGSSYSNVEFDGSGNLYGTTYSGGSHGDGVVWQIMP